MPAISVLMPVYNAGNFLKEAVDSILMQTFTDFEFLIFNDGSTDDSKKILQSYVDPRIKLFDFEINHGYVHLLNLGLDRAQGKYIARMDADDVAEINRFEKQYKFLESNSEYILCGSNFTFLGGKHISDLPIDDNEIKLRMLAITPFCHPSVFIRTEIIKRNDIKYDERFMPAEDLDLWTRLVDLGKFQNLSESLVFYRIHSSNISLKKRSVEQDHLLKLTQKRYISKFFDNANLTTSELDFLTELILNDQFNYDTLSKCGDVVQKIIEGNHSYLVDSSEVHNFLVQKVFYRCTTSTHEGLKVFFLANRFGFNKFRLLLNIKLLIKSLIRYRA